MADIQITGKQIKQLDKKAVLDGTESYVLQDSTGTKQVDSSVLKEWVKANLINGYPTPNVYYDGTLADPIPYERNMVLEKGKYYTQFDVLYECITDSIVGYDVDLSGLLSLVKVVEQ